MEAQYRSIGQIRIYLPSWRLGIRSGRGMAIAEVLFGDYNPGGKLPITFPKAASDLPAFEDYDIVKGKTYMYQRIKALYPLVLDLVILILKFQTNYYQSSNCPKME